MRILVTGATGLLGGALVESLRAAGEEVVRAVRRPASGPDDVRWDARTGFLDRPPQGLDAVVHLAGEALSGPRWTAARRRALRDSRVGGTRRLAEALAGMNPRPRVLISASAVGWYGDRGDEILTERSSAGHGFLADLACAWEEATAPASAAGIRVVAVRSGLVIAREGGVLPRLVTPFRLGLGGPLAGGRSWWSWIALDDHVAAMRYLLARDDLAGPFNLVAPAPVTNSQLTRVLARVLRRPAVFPVPKIALELLLGADQAGMVLSSQRVLPERLEAAGFTFQHPDLESTLRNALAEAA